MPDTVVRRATTPLAGIVLTHSWSGLMGWECECGDSSRGFTLGGFTWSSAKAHKEVHRG